MTDDTKLILSKLDKLTEDVSKLNTDVADLKEKYEILSYDAYKTKENINILAENHLRLDKEINECLCTESEKAMMLIRLNFLEFDMQTVKKKLILSV